MSELRTHSEQDSFTTSFNDVIEHAQYIQGASDSFQPHPSGMLWGLGFMYLGVATSTPALTMLGLGLFVCLGLRCHERLNLYSPSFFSLRPARDADELVSPALQWV
ncbi:hypothetical protein [Legionella quinlivanii]|uniref:hypothetical protein n=1 Tax=Legionella quinlivanii TaxID=45073 RepID=UPI0011BEB1F4|nr:hypothetical protein [Legionella quinlivanii]